MGQGQVCLGPGDRIYCVPGQGTGASGEASRESSEAWAGRSGWGVRVEGSALGCLEKSRLWGEEQWETGYMGERDLEVRAQGQA